MKKAIRELFRVFVSTGIAGVSTQVHTNPENFMMFVALIPVLRFASKYLHERFPGRLWDWLPF